VTANADAAKAIAGTVRDLQQTQLWQSFATDDCLRFLLQDANLEISRWDEPKKTELFQFCKDQIKAAAEWRFKELYLSYGCDPDGKNCPKVVCDAEGKSCSKDPIGPPVVLGTPYNRTGNIGPLVIPPAEY
jgi:hypothetical protein